MSKDGGERVQTEVLLGGSRMIGNEKLRAKLAREIRESALSHAYLIEGARGMGKHLLAKELCAAVSCLERDGDRLPCGRCKNCEKILADKSPDVRVIGKSEGKASIGVDDVRFLRADVLIPPNDLEHRFYIIEDAQDMTSQAQNAVLLTVEEPPPYVMFLLLCENGTNILETVRSRAPSLRLCPVENDRMDAYLQAEQRSYAALPVEEREELLCIACGSVGRALTLLDGRARKGVVDKRRFVAQAVEHCLSTGRRDTLRSVEIISGFGNVREDVASRLSMMMEAVRDLILLKKSDEVPLCFYADRLAAQQLSQSTSLSTLVQLLGATEYTLSRVRRNANIRLALSELLLCDGIDGAKQS